MRLCVQESLNFINRSKCKEEYGCKDDTVTAGKGTRRSSRN